MNGKLSFELITNEMSDDRRGQAIGQDFSRENRSIHSLECYLFFCEHVDISNIGKINMKRKVSCHKS